LSKLQVFEYLFTGQSVLVFGNQTMVNLIVMAKVEFCSTSCWSYDVSL